MASEQQVKKYLAYWFLLGKKVIIDGNQGVLPQPVMQGENYSQAFEDCWRQIISSAAGNSYLQGTNETIGELLTDKWDITDCARCSMPVPMIDIGVSSLVCTCNDLANWPNLDLPKPRSPVNNQAQLTNIRDRVQNRDWKQE